MLEDAVFPIRSSPGSKIDESKALCGDRNNPDHRERQGAEAYMNENIDSHCSIDISLDSSCHFTMSARTVENTRFVPRSSSIPKIESKTRFSADVPFVE